MYKLEMDPLSQFQRFREISLEILDIKKQIQINEFEIYEAKLRRHLRKTYVLEGISQRSGEEQSKFILDECVNYAYELYGFDDYVNYLEMVNEKLKIDLDELILIQQKIDL